MEEMTFDYYRIRICPAPFIKIGNEQYSKYKVFFECVYHDSSGRLFAQIKKITTYNSIEDMESDFDGFLNYTIYENEIIDMEAEYEDDSRYI